MSILAGEKYEWVRKGAENHFCVMALTAQELELFRAGIAALFEKRCETFAIIKAYAPEALAVEGKSNLGIEALRELGALLDRADSDAPI